MWFKNIRVYRLAEHFQVTPEVLSEKLSAGAFRPCGRQEQTSYGWVSPLGHLGEQFVHAAQARYMICTRKEEKVLPSTYVKEQVDERVTGIRESEGRSVGRRERLTIKEEVVQGLLPRAFIKSERLYAYIDTQAGWLLVDTASAPKAEALLGALRKALGSCPVAPVQTHFNPAHVMSQWLLDLSPLPETLMLGGDCQMQEGQAEGGTILFRQQALQDQQVTSHLASGMQVQKLALQWQGGISAVVDSDLTIRRVRFEDNILEHSAVADDAVAQFDQDFSVMSIELSHFLTDLFAAFGGECIEEPSVEPPSQQEQLEGVHKRPMLKRSDEVPLALAD